MAPISKVNPTESTVQFKWFNLKFVYLQSLNPKLLLRSCCNFVKHDSKSSQWRQIVNSWNWHAYYAKFHVYIRILYFKKEQETWHDIISNQSIISKAKVNSKIICSRPELHNCKQGIRAVFHASLWYDW